jgi:phage terminase large subunit-like protein
VTTLADPPINTRADPDAFPTDIIRPKASEWLSYLDGETSETFSWLRHLADADTEYKGESLLARIDESGQQYRRIKTKLDPMLFALLYLRDHLRGDATGGDITFCDAHLDWCREALGWVVPSTRPRQKRDVYVAPRELGKSTWFFLVLPLWAAAHGHRKFIAAFADAGTQAEMHLSTFKNELETNEALKRDFPDLCEPATRYRGMTQSDTKGLTIRKSGFVFGARGADSKTLGMKVGHQRPDMLILDDIEPGEDQYSEYQVEGRLTTIIDVIFPLSETAQVVIAGTVTLPGSIIHQLVKSVIEPDDDIPEWIGEQNMRVHYYPPIIANDDGTERSIWPAKWPISFLQAIRHTRSFLKNFANSPLGMNGDYWSKDDFTYGSLEGKTRVMLSIDPAMKDKKGSDWTGMAVVGWKPPATRDPRRKAMDVDDVTQRVVGNLGTCEVMHAKAVKLIGERLRTEVLRILEMFPEIGLVLIEVNQGGEHWIDILHHLPCKIQLIEQTADKRVRASQSLAHYQRHRVVHTERLGSAEEQMVAFPRAPHDDMVDAIGSAVTRFLRPPKKPAMGGSNIGSYA